MWAVCVRFCFFLMAEPYKEDWWWEVTGEDQAKSAKKWGSWFLPSCVKGGREGGNVLDETLPPIQSGHGMLSRHRILLMSFFLFFANCFVLSKKRDLWFHEINPTYFWSWGWGGGHVLGRSMKRPWLSICNALMRNDPRVGYQCPYEQGGLSMPLWEMTSGWTIIIIMPIVKEVYDNDIH